MTLYFIKWVGTYSKGSLAISAATINDAREKSLTYLKSNYDNYDFEKIEDIIELKDDLSGTIVEQIYIE